MSFTSFVVHDLRANPSAVSPVIVLFVPKVLSRGFEVAQLLANLLGQLIAHGPAIHLPSDVVDIYNHCKSSETIPPQSAIATLFMTLVKSSSRVYLIANESVRDQDLMKVWFILLHAGVKDLHLLAHTKNYYEPTPVLVCDHCDQPTAAYWHCTICNDGDFDTCLECKSRGLLCLNPSHSLELFDASEDQIIVDVDALYLSDQSEQVFAQKVKSQMISSFQSYPADPKRRSSLVDGAYEQVMRQGIMSSQNEDLAMAALEVVCHALWPLEKHEFEHALRYVLRCRRPQSESAATTTDTLVATGGFLIIQESTVRLFDSSLSDYFEKTRHRWFPFGHANMAAACLDALWSRKLLQTSGLPLDSRSFYGHSACTWGCYLRACPAGLAVEDMALSYLRNTERLQAGNSTAFKLQSSDMLYGYDVGQGLDAIHVCSIFGLHHLIRRLSPKTLDLDKRVPHHGRTPLSYACKMNQDQTVEVLLTLGANPNLQYDGGPTVLHEAVRLEYPLVVGSLLCSPSLSLTSLTTQDSEQVPVLLSLIRLQSIDLLKLALARHDIDINEEDHVGQTALWYLLSNSYHDQASAFQESALKLIAEDARCNINAVAIGGRNYIMRVLRSRISSLELLDVLLDRGADLNHKDEHGESAIFYAITLRYDMKVAAKLIKEGADLTVRNYRGQGLLHRLVSDLGDSQGHPYLDLLIDSMPALVNFQDERGRTPLHVALFLGKTHLAKVLLARDSDVSILDNYGRSAFDVACQYGRLSLLERLMPPLAARHHRVSFNNNGERSRSLPYRDMEENGEARVVMPMASTGTTVAGRSEDPTSTVRSSEDTRTIQTTVTESSHWLLEKNLGKVPGWSLCILGNSSVLRNTSEGYHTLTYHRKIRRAP